MSQVPTPGSSSVANAKSTVRAPAQGRAEPADAGTNAPHAPHDLTALKQDVNEFMQRFKQTLDHLSENFASLPPATPRGSGQELRELSQHLDHKLNAMLSKIENIGHSISAIAEAERAAPESNPSDELLSHWKRLLEDHARVVIRHVADQTTTAIDSQRSLLLDVHQELRQATAQILDAVTPPPAPVEESTPSMSSSDRAWQTAVFGSVLAENSGISEQLTELCQRVLDGDAAAGAFAGYLLIFQNSPFERRPQLLKELGEAYYRCFPKTAGMPEVEDLFEQSLVRWLESSCEQAGFQNSIELIHLGERFDASRHTSTERGGVEITDVHGWVVLRNRDKVYTKAVVSAR